MAILKTTYLRVALPTPLRRYFDYLAPQDIDSKALIPGVRVQVPFQSRTLVGILMSVDNHSNVPYQKLKKAHQILDFEPILPAEIFQLCQWAADYYQVSLGDVLAFAMPTLLRKGKSISEIKKSTTETHHHPEKILSLNAAQKNAVDKIVHAQIPYPPFLLNGVTGSGKTEVYLQSIAHYLKQEKQILVLVPEISLTPQTIERFQNRFDVVIATLHSSLSGRQRLQAWCDAKNGEAKIVIGTRSAIFTPFKNLGLIIVDEEHDQSFKQQDRFRYHARDLAIKRANMQNIPIVLGSATPSLESLLNVERERYISLSLPERAGNANLPSYQIIDLQKSKVIDGISESLLTMVDVELKKNNQVLLFLNRRGFAPVLYCIACHYVFECKRCDAKLVYHKAPKRLQCHVCDSKRNVPTHCEKCYAESLETVGVGTQRLEQTLQTYFSDVPIIRVDRDSTRKKGALQDCLQEINSQEKAILLGTQMLAKGHHFPNVTLVGVIDADSGFFSSDFRAAEQMGQLLIQVAGRAGRQDKAGVVAIQTRNPDFPLLQILLQKSYNEFANTILHERQIAELPPYTHVAICKAESYQSESAHNFLLMLKQAGNTLDPRINTLGPVKALIAKRKGYHCWHLIFKTKDRRLLQHYLKQLAQKMDETNSHPVRWVIDVDPMEI